MFPLLYYYYKCEHHNNRITFFPDLSGTTVSPWIVTLDALEPFACDAPKQVA